MRQKQIGRVGARNQQNQTHHRHEERRERDDELPELRGHPHDRADGRVPSLVAPRVSLRKLPRQNTHFRLRLSGSAAGLDSPYQENPVGIPVGKQVIAGGDFVLHDDGSPEIRHQACFKTSKAGRGNPHDGIAVSIQSQGLSHHGGIRTEVLLPEGVAEDHDRGSSGCPVFFGHKHPPEDRPYT